MTLSGDFCNYPNSMFRPGTIVVPVVQRDRLNARITGPDMRKITIVAAPAGYGKTVLLTHAYQADRARGRRCIWLSIGKMFGDEDLIKLLHAGIDQARVPLPLPGIVTVDGLVNQIEGHDAPVSVIIDGLDPDVLKDTEALLWHLIKGTSPDTRFLIATETALPPPLVRLEASGLLRTIGAADLAFDRSDIEALGDVTQLPDWASALNERVEGWPTLVQLALSRFREEPDLPLPLLSGCQHDIATFLHQDVLRHLRPDQFARLMDASVVDQICGSLLDALSEDMAGSAMLGEFVARGVPMRASRDREWFCLHPLLRDYLYDRLQRHDPDRLPLLHQRAATWLLSSGDEQAALRHGTASGNIDFLRTLYPSANITRTWWSEHDETDNPEDHGMRATIDVVSEPKWRTIFDLIQSGQLDQARAAIVEARRHAQISAGAAQSNGQPADWELIYIDLLMRVFDDRLPDPDQLEDLRDRLMRTPGVPPSIPAAVSEFLIVSRFRHGDLSGIAAADHDLWYTSALAPLQSKIYVLMELGIAALELGDIDLASRHLENARLRAIQTYGRESSHAHAASTLLAEVALERGDHAISLNSIEQHFPMLKQGELWFNLVASAMTTRSALNANRSWSDVLRALELPPSLANHSGMWRLPPVLIAQRLRLAVIGGHDLEAARKDRATLSNLGLLDLAEPDGFRFGWRVVVPAQLAVIRFDLADRKAEAALSRCVALRPMLETRRYVRRLVELDLLQGRAMVELGDRVAGCALIRAALKSSVDSGMLQSFEDEGRFLREIIPDIQFAEDLSAAELAFLDQSLNKLSKPSSRPTRYVTNGQAFDLSGREDELLRAMMTGKTFKEISFALNISINTTKMHRTRLYRKLGCNSRSHAMAMAQELIAR